MERKHMGQSEHWNTVFAMKGARDVSWFEALPAVSLQLIEAAGLGPGTCVLDVGGGDSHLVDELSARGVECLAVLDVSSAALERARRRLGAAAQTTTWIEADVTGNWTSKPMDIWHDRAMFHFLTSPDDRAAYRTHLLDTLKPGGAAIIATFAPDGPEMCSGLPVVPYSPESLSAELGPELELVESVFHTHATPAGGRQSFQYSRFRRR
jgi:SAM-dependent methyltransferase